MYEQQKLLCLVYFIQNKTKLKLQSNAKMSDTPYAKEYRS